METLKTIDAITVIVALATVVINAAVRAYGRDPGWASRSKATVDLLNGTTLVPFFVLMVCVFNDSLLKELVEHGKVILSTAGAMGLIFVIGEIFKTGLLAKKAPQLATQQNVANNPPAGATSGASTPQPK